MKQEFIEFVKKLMSLNPEATDKLMTDNIHDYMEILETSIEEKPLLTDNGKTVLKYLQASKQRSFRTRNVADDVGMNSRSVSGTFRKLCADGYCEKVSQDPIVYALTDKGRTFKLD